MVGHTGNLAAVTKAVEATDAGVAELLEALASRGGRAVVTADHGNCEQMWNPTTEGPHTAHTLNLVEIFVVGEGFSKDATTLRTGSTPRRHRPHRARSHGFAQAGRDDRRESDRALSPIIAILPNKALRRGSVSA